MNISRKIVLTGVVALGIFALGSAGAAAVAHTLTIEDRAGAVQKIAPVTTGTTAPSPSATPLDDRSDGPAGTTTVAPAEPINVDDQGEVRHTGTEDGATHDVGAGAGGVSGGTGSGQDSDGSGDSGSGTSGSGGATSGSGSPDSSGSHTGSGHGDDSGDTGAHH